MRKGKNTYKGFIEPTVIDGVLYSNLYRQQDEPAASDGPAFTAGELAALDLGGFPKSQTGIEIFASLENWPKRQLPDGTIVYPFNSLPIPARHCILMCRFSVHHSLSALHALSRAGRTA